MSDGGGIVRRVSTREVYRNRWMALREDEIRRPDGSAGIYSVVDKPDFALVIPAEPDGFHLVEQYRYPVGERCWEFPLGGWPPGHAGGDPADLARAELAEETGFRAERIVHLGRLFVAPGVMSQRFHAFLATGLTPGEVAREESENDMRQTWVSRERFEEMVRAGTVRDSHSIAAYALFTLYERSGG